MNLMAWADINPQMASMASTIASTLQQMSLSLGLVIGSLLTGCHLGAICRKLFVSRSPAHCIRPFIRWLR